MGFFWKQRGGMRLFLSVCLFVARAIASDVVVLDESNFDTVVNGDKHVLVEFFAPWCGHCKNLAPEYELAATAFKNVDDVVIASVDADQHKALGGRFDVKGFPTLKYFPKGGDVSSPDAYSGGRTAADIVAFVNDKAGTRGFVRKAPTAVRVLDKNNFDKVVDGSKHVLVEFYAPWCGHCKSLAPKYEELAKIYATEEDVVVANVDADAAPNKPLGSRFGVTGFPTIKFFPKGSTEATDYSSGREVADFVKFLNDKAGTQRLVSGGLDDKAGRIEKLDALAKELVSKAKSSIEAEVQAIGETLSAAEKKVADFYALVARKFEKDGAAFITKQKERLSKLLKSDSVTAAKRDEFQRKHNIMSQFE